MIDIFLIFLFDLEIYCQKVFQKPIGLFLQIELYIVEINCQIR